MAKRNHACRINTDLSVGGFHAVVMENETFRLTVLPGKGTDLTELLHKPTDTDFMWWTDLGLRRPHALYTDFQSQYEGGWQEIFPSLNSAHPPGGVRHETYGEVSLVPWTVQVLEDDPLGIAVEFEVQLRTLPVKLTKIIRMASGETGFRLTSTATNRVRIPLTVDWGQHITFGSPFLRPGTRLRLPSPSLPSYTVPAAQTPGGFSTVNDLEAGWYELCRPGDLGARVSWDLHTWPTLWFWKDFGADPGPPYFGQHFNLGLEPFSSLPGTAQAAPVRRLTLPPESSHESWLRFEVIHDH